MGPGDGRVYTIVYTASDASGNTADATVEVEVPHDQSGFAFASNGYSEDGSELLADALSVTLVITADQSSAHQPPLDHIDVGWIDVEQADLGNTAGIVNSAEAWFSDTDDDGFDDLVLVYPAQDLRDLVEASDELDGSVGLHFHLFHEQERIDYRVPDIFDIGPAIPLDSETGVEEPSEDGAPDIDVTRLTGIYPNPVNPRAQVAFQLAEAGAVQVRIYDAAGSLVRTLLDGYREAGEAELTWDGRDEAGQEVGSGVYFVRLTAKRQQDSAKLVILR